MNHHADNHEGSRIMGFLLTVILATLFTAQRATAQQYRTYPQQMEHLTRGVTALPAQKDGIFVSWRLLGTDRTGTTFTLLRDGRPIAENITQTNFVDSHGTLASHYQVVTNKPGGKKETSATISAWKDLYCSIPIERPEGGTLGRNSFSYSPNDCSVGDVDGDGDYELFLKWDPSNAHDNSHDGLTAPVIIDCYKLNINPPASAKAKASQKLWRINLGPNIRAGAHYTQFMVYDFDRDGHAEMICKTAPGTIDGTGRYVTEAATDEGIRKANNKADYRNQQGRILSGPEYLTVFDGRTGRALHTIYYRPNRAFDVGGEPFYDKQGWGDRGIMGNRGERFLAGVAWLDGPMGKPSAVMCRGYYTPSHLWAVDFDGKHLSTKWFHASTSPTEYSVTDASGNTTRYSGLKATAFGQGAHSLAVGDVDGDGCDEITYGSAAIDHDGTLLYSTGLGHGDATHLGDLDPDRPGLEFYMVHESFPYGADLRDAKTGEFIFRETARDDTGRGLAADIDATHRGFEHWHIFRQAVRDIHGNVIGQRNPSINFRIYWDGDLQDELVANLGRRTGFGPFIEKWNGRQAEPLPLSNGKQLYEMGHSASCNWTKATPNLQADILGDWREELIYWDNSDASHLNIFTTNIPTQYAVPTLMHDNIYRLSICWQNTAYNQPPHLGYYLPDKFNSERDIFIYSPDSKQGLHAALRTGDTWNDLGQIMASDYGSWGAEKRMYNPSVVRAADGSWRAVWQLNDHSPCFAAAYSRDLITWRPQDYPLLSTSQCISPVVKEGSNGEFDIFYKTSQGKHHLTARTDFRHFSADEACNASDTIWQRDTATIDGKLRDGCLFRVKDYEVSALVQHFDAIAEDARKSSERMHDDAKNLSWLKEPVNATLHIDSRRDRPISDKLVGVFFEDISYAADGGLYAELVQNRDFEYTEADRKGWNSATAWHSGKELHIDTIMPLSKNNPHYVLLTTDTLRNEGWDGISVKAGERYDFSLYARNPNGNKTLLVQLVAEDGSIIAKATVKTKGKNWQRYNATLTAATTANKAQLVIIPQKSNEVALDMISLFPQNTFKNRKNGLRRDLAEAIAALHPKFVRFPGGCMSHGNGLDNIYHWHHTIGELYDRKPDFNIWHYHQTRGLGFYEYFQFCEDIGAEPLPVLAAGVPCQNSRNNSKGYGGQQGGIPMTEMQAYIDELLHLIEWANGDPATSEWARKRADAGHPEPFNLKYIGIGNEDIISTAFEERYEMICRAIRECYPDIKICGTVGPFHSPSSDYIEGWDFTRKNPDLQYMVDEHYYESTGWFLHHQDYYDHYDRQGTKVYLGEYAASTKARRPNVETALAEAIHLCNIERNGDVVAMTSYAPLLCKDGHSNWNPDMIYFNNTGLRCTPSYETQRLFGTYSGDRYVTSRIAMQQRAVSHRVVASVVRSTATGKTYVKLVNALPVEVNLDIRGMRIPEGCNTEGFSGKPEDLRVTAQHGKTGSNIVLAPYSFQIIELEEQRN